MTKYKFVFIDLDDTIWDFHSNAKSALEEVYEEYRFGRYFDNFEQYFDLYEKQNLILWEQYGRGEISKDELSLERFLHPLRHVGITEESLAIETGTRYLELLPYRTNLMPGAGELLDYLLPRYPITIVSNGFIEVQYKKLKSAGIEHYFRHVVLSEHAKALKPDKQIFDYALALNHANANDTIMIGDSYQADILGAKNAKIDSVFYDIKGANMPKSDALYTIEHLDELYQIL